jgi:replicative DNA helicase
MSRAKKNRSIDENRAISQRIDQLRMQGLNKERATAAAFRMFKDGELTVKIDNVRAKGKKSAQEVAIEKAVIAAATKIRQQAEQDKKRIQRAEILARRARLKAKRTGEPETAEELESRLRTEPIARTIDRLRRRQI